MIRTATLLTTLALAATACTLYIDTDDNDHGPWQTSQDAGGPSADAQPWQDTDAQPYFPDAGLPSVDAQPWQDTDAQPYFPDAGLPSVDAQPIPQDACGVP